jgi:hypothetical protein
MLTLLAEAPSHPANAFGGLIVLIIFAFIGAAALKALKPSRRKPRPAKPEERWTPPAADAPEFPFLRKKYFFSAAERSFYEVLQRVVGEQVHLFAKVRLADVVYVARGTESWQTHFNRIQSKHIDFLLCDRQQIRHF